MSDVCVLSPCKPISDNPKFLLYTCHTSVGYFAYSFIEDMACIISLTKLSNIFPIFIFVSCFPPLMLSQSFRSLQLPPKVTGPESIAFEFGTSRFYVGVADGRILQYNGPRVGFRDFGFTGPNR